MELLNDALLKYHANTTPYSALHLAAAAEELFGAYVKAKKESTSFEDTKESLLGILGYNAQNSHGKTYKQVSKAFSDHLNHEKNNVKHGHGIFEADIHNATEDSLDRAIENLYKLKQHYAIEESDLIKAFKNRHYLDIILEEEKVT